MPDQPDIPRVHKINSVNVSTPIDLDGEVADKKVKGEDKGMVYYAVEKDSRLERIFDKVLDTLAGKNKAGRGLGKIKDVVTWIFPKTEPIDRLTDEIGDYIKSKRTNKSIMEPQKPWYKSKTINAVIAFLVILLVQLFDINIAAEDIQQPLEIIGQTVASLIAIYGRVTAKQEIGKK